MQTYVIADTHFGHANIIRYENRPFSSVEHMDESLINNWNNAVKEEDRIYVLGDFALCGADRIREIVSGLNGKKYLILGNHDNRSRGFWLTVGFMGVFNEPFILDKLVLSHYPQENQLYHNIHGHSHSKKSYFTKLKTHTCVSVELINYTPININNLEVKNATQKKEII